MCLGSLFGGGKKPSAPVMPAPPPMPSPPPVPTAVDSQSSVQDATELRRRRTRAGLASTMKSGGLFGAGSGSELSSIGTGSKTLG